MTKSDLQNRYILTVEEASIYFHIGETKIRAILANNPYANFVLHNGTRTLIKRRLFEDFIDSINEI